MINGLTGSLKMDEYTNLLKRVKKNGMAITKPSSLTRKISKKTDYTVFNNRNKHQSIIIDEKKLRKLLGTKWF